MPGNNQASPELATFIDVSALGIKLTDPDASPAIRPARNRQTSESANKGELNP